MSGIVSTARSQLANLRLFAPLFRPRAVLRAGLALPRDLFSRSGRAGAPLAVNVLVTGRCNLRCDLCQADGMQGRSYEELTPDELERIAAEVRHLQPCFVFGGGEPFVRDDLLDLAAAVKRQGLPLAIVTNGVRMTHARVERLRGLGVDVVIVSLHGLEAVHEAVTGVPGSFRRTTANVEALTRWPRTTRVILNVVLTEANLPQLDELVALGRTLGVDHVRFEHLLFVTGAQVEAQAAACRAFDSDDGGWLADGFAATRMADEQRPAPGFADRLGPQMAALAERHGRFASFKPVLDPHELRAWYEGDVGQHGRRHGRHRPGSAPRRRCPFVWRSLFLDPSGHVVPCERYPAMQLGNVREEPLLAIWNGPRFRALRRRLRDGTLPACARCDKL